MRSVEIDDRPTLGDGDAGQLHVRDRDFRMMGTPRRVQPYIPALCGIPNYNYLDRVLPKYARIRLYDGLFGDNAEAGLDLAIATPPEFRARLAVTAYYLGTPYSTYRCILSYIWSKGDSSLQSEVVWDLRLLRSIFRSARFNVPLSGPLRVYRGVADVDPRTAVRGLSWTTSRDVASWFAIRHAFGAQEPLVVFADVDARDVIYFDDERSESEVILRRIPLTAVDAEPSTWKFAANRHESRLQDLRQRVL